MKVEWGAQLACLRSSLAGYVSVLAFNGNSIVPTPVSSEHQCHREDVYESIRCTGSVASVGRLLKRVPCTYTLTRTQ
ncbi:uncharacterized protein CC84DRAFT_180025 [Paraphaeosphaeria sporulosa]|uniref:Uncharacterized protein n=1 Tax=Paraphaeosphaeria sporulosa TaxID=1460663 RepID=A0A177D0W7_9PLEO|nr:uncharacterized protein CC84DRAFT_180025 [Paraphaeosphaeria sporulosa]OAG13101.1 hypothetical protein CC84DRAFT_180025 [Paraphaeosphaeria sporulosa]